MLYKNGSLNTIGGFIEMIETKGNFSDKQADFSLIQSGSLFALQVHGSGIIPISDYKIQSSADGKTELCVTISGTANELEIRASLKE